jgi:hypothetical protein
MMGGALGLAVLASIAASRTSSLLATGHPHLDALTGGYHAAFVIGAICALLAMALAAVRLRNTATAGASADQRPAGQPAPAEA